MGTVGDNSDECKEIQSLIPGYLAGKLSLKEARAFTAHLKKCSECRDEMEISYLLDEEFRGMGFAKEALVSLMALARDIWGISGFTANVKEGNVRSKQLADELGIKVG